MIFVEPAYLPTGENVMHHNHFDRSNLESLVLDNLTSARSIRSRTRLILCLIPLLALHLAACRTLRPQAGEHEIDIRFLNGGGEEPLIEPARGWPLTLSLTANEDKLVGIGPCYRGQYPGLNSTAYLLFEDLDGCPPWRCQALPDKTQVEFTPGLHLPSDSGLDLMEEDKAYGYGANPHLPGLMVVAASDRGAAADEAVDQVSPLDAENLAGFFHSVAYELKDAQGRTSILAHMNVVEDLLLPVEPGQEVTIRAFVVNGRAPDSLTDANGDGIVDIADAKQQSLRLLSNQATLKFTLPEVRPFVPLRVDPGTIEDPPR